MLAYDRRPRSTALKAEGHPWTGGTVTLVEAERPRMESMLGGLWVVMETAVLARGMIRVQAGMNQDSPQVMVNCHIWPKAV